MGMGLMELERLKEVERRLDALGVPVGVTDRAAVLEQQVIALALQLQELNDRLTKIETRSKPGPKPKV